MRKLLSLLIAVTVLGCSAHDPGTSVSQDWIDIQEAVFRHQFRHNASGFQPSVFFISMGEPRGASTLDYPDPEPALVARFASNIPPVKPASSAILMETPEDLAVVMDRQTKHQGIIFVIRSIKIISPDTAQAFGGYYAASLSASYNRYILRRKRNKWIVVHDKLLTIS